VFAAFGDYIVMWDARTGADQGQLQLPSVAEESAKIGQVFDDTEMPNWIYNNPIIQSMLLYNGRLVVFVGNISMH
jgi:hypothetical protein